MDHPWPVFPPTDISRHTCSLSSSGPVHLTTPEHRQVVGCFHGEKPSSWNTVYQLSLPSFHSRSLKLHVTELVRCLSRVQEYLPPSKKASFSSQHPQQELPVTPAQGDATHLTSLGTLMHVHIYAYVYAHMSNLNF